MSVTGKEGTEKEDVNAIVLTVPGSSLTSKTIGIPIVKHSSGKDLALSALASAKDWTPIRGYSR